MRETKRVPEDLSVEEKLIDCHYDRMLEDFQREIDAARAVLDDHLDEMRRGFQPLPPQPE
jgi:hypothetical protein